MGVSTQEQKTLVVGKHTVVVRGMDVELYESGKGGRLRYVDHGPWRFGGYVRWEREERHHDFTALDDIDGRLRSVFPPGAGTVPRATPAQRSSSLAV